MEAPVVVVDPANVEIVSAPSPMEVIEYPWRQMEGEPWFWFQRFIKYFLPLGPGRSLIKAYETMVGVEFPEVAEARRLNEPKKKKATNLWSKRAREWNWRERSKAYDKFTYSEALQEVDKARVTLLRSADKAALTLVGALTNARLCVAASKEILDRVGLPGTTNVGLGPIEKFTADEFRQAESEVDAWEAQSQKQISESNG